MQFVVGNCPDLTQTDLGFLIAARFYTVTICSSLRHSVFIRTRKITIEKVQALKLIVSTNLNLILVVASWIISFY